MQVQKLNSSTIMDASAQWATRPADQRFTSLHDMQATLRAIRERSQAAVVTNRALFIKPANDNPNAGLVIDSEGREIAPTNWSFQQIAGLAGFGIRELRKLPAPLAADCINWCMRKRDVEEVGTLTMQREADSLELLAATGPNYGRIWNGQIVDSLVNMFGDGRTGQFRVPGEFGQQVEITKANTTLYASDRDCFIFLADEENRIEIPNRRDGKPGTLARGFFVRNSDVGAASFDIDTFLFDYVCQNRIVWGVSDHARVSFRHSKGAPERFAETIAPALARYAQEKTASITQAIEDSRNARIGDAEAVREFLQKRFSVKQSAQIMAAHMEDEGRPIESLWDAATGITAAARALEHQDSRFEMEKQAGAVLNLAA